MPKEYRTIQEVAGPLMMVQGVENVTYNELGEIELANGETRRCKVLEINGTNALVQLFENSTGINLAESKVRFLAHGAGANGVVKREEMLGGAFKLHVALVVMRRELLDTLAHLDIHDTRAIAHGTCHRVGHA